MTIVLKGEKIAGHAVTLSIRDGSYGGKVIFVVTWGKAESESVSSYEEFKFLDRALDKYKEICRQLSQKAFTLFEALQYCRDNNYTPHQTAEYLYSLGYCV